MLVKNKNVHLAKQRALLGNWNLKGRGGIFREPEQIGCFHTQECALLGSWLRAIDTAGKETRMGDGQGVSPARNRPTPSILGPLTGPRCVILVYNRIISPSVNMRHKLPYERSSPLTCTIMGLFYVRCNRIKHQPVVLHYILLFGLTLMHIS